MMTDRPPDLAWLTPSVRDVLTALPLNLFIKTRGSSFALVTEHLAALLGTTAARMVGQCDANHVSADRAAKYKAGDEAVFREARALTFDETFELAGIQGRRRTVKLPVRGPDGQPEALVGIVTALDGGEGALNQRDDAVMAYRNIWRVARDGMVLADVTTGAIVDINPAAEALLGRSRSQVIGTDQSLLYTADSRPLVEAKYLEALNSTGILQGLAVQTTSGGETPVEVSVTSPFELDGRTVVLGLFRDVRRQVADRRQLEKKAWALTAYANAADALRRAQSEAELTQSVCESIVAHSDYALAWVGIADDTPGRPVRVAGVAGKARGYADGICINWDEQSASSGGPAGRAILTQQPQVMSDVRDDAAFAPWRERALENGIRSGVAVPLVSGERSLGALMVYASEPNWFGEEEVSLFSRLGDAVAHGLRAFEQKRALADEEARCAEMRNQLRVALNATIATITQAMEQRDPYTAGHERRVSELAVAIGQELGWDAERLNGLRVAGLIHDIGKISVPSELLVKPTRLSPPEFELIKQHAEAGYQIVKDIPFPWPVARIVREHHERLDGSGYPQKLSGDQILPESRVLAVADSVESMASHRPYRPARGVDVAMREIQAGAGTSLDRDAVAACVRLFREKGYRIPD